MNRQYAAYGIVGTIIGLVLGFVIANWTWNSGSGRSQAASSGEQKSASVNSSSAPNAQLPPNHPPIDSGQTIPAPPLPGGGGEAAGGAATGAAPAQSSVELPSLDPLPASSKDERAEQKYKNIQILKGIPSDRLTSVMFAFKSALGVDCTYCHIKDQFEKDDKPTKQMARKMITIVRETNTRLGGAGRVTCFTCHRGQTRPAQ